MTSISFAPPAGGKEEEEAMEAEHEGSEQWEKRRSDTDEGEAADDSSGELSDSEVFAPAEDCGSKALCTGQVALSLNAAELEERRSTEVQLVAELILGPELCTDQNRGEPAPCVFAPRLRLLFFSGANCTITITIFVLQKRKHPGREPPAPPRHAGYAKEVLAAYSWNAPLAVKCSDLQTRLRNQQPVRGWAH